MKHLKQVVAVIFMMSLLLPLGAQASEASSKYVELEAQWEDGQIAHIETLFKDGVTYGNFITLGRGSGLQWEKEDDQTTVLSNNEKRIVVRMGSSIAEVDGQEVDMGREPVWYISHLYVPIKFLAAALEGEVVNRDTKTGKVTVAGLNNYTDTFYGSTSGYRFIIRKADGDLEVTNAYTGQKSSIPLGMNINMNTHELTYNFEWTPNYLLIVSIDYSDRKTGNYDLYTLIFKNQGLIRKSIAYGLTEPHETLKSDGTIQLIDDKNIRIIDDESGNVLEVIPR